MPVVNGRKYQHATTDFQLGAADSGVTWTFDSFTKLTYKVGAKKKPTHNSRGKIDGYTIDKEETDGSFTVRLSEWMAFKDFVGQNFPDLGIGQIELEGTVTFGDTVDTMKTEKISAMIQEDARSSEDNQDALMVEVPLFVFKVTDHNGKEFIAAPQR